LYLDLELELELELELDQIVMRLTKGRNHTETPASRNPSLKPETAEKPETALFLALFFPNIAFCL